MFEQLILSNEVIDESFLKLWMDEQIRLHGDETSAVTFLLSSLEETSLDSFELNEPVTFASELLGDIELPDNISGAEMFRLTMIHILRQKLLLTEPN